jgi:predicted alpha/beta superfamily hydrolase
MSRFAALLASCLLCITSLVGQSKSSQPKPTPGVTTITSFDKDHTVIGWLEIVPFESKIFHNKRMLRVLVPANYFSPHNRTRGYPVLYLQDGENLFDEATSPQGEWHVDETVEHLVGAFKIPPMFVVGIDSAGDQRDSEYLAYPDPLNKKVTEQTGLGKEYARFITTEVMPFIERRYRISRGPQNTGIGGSSYGADVALYAALKNPTLFGHVLIESPELRIGDRQLIKDAEKASLLPRKIYVGIGTKEGNEPSQSPLLVEDVRQLEAVLVKKGMGATRLRIAIEEGGQDNEAAWSRRLPDALLFLYGQ